MATPTSLSSTFNSEDTSTTNSSLEDDEQWTPVVSLTWLIIVGFIYGLIILFTVVGNAFIIAAYAVDVKIRSRASSLLIVNLAIADFGIGITFIFNFVFLVYDAWPLGEVPCKLWIVLDYTCSFMSVVSIMLISLDRYWMVKKKLEYRNFQTKTRIFITAIICWIAVLTFYTVTAFGYGAFTNTNFVDFADDCEMEYLYSIPFSATMIFVEFFIPFIIIVYLNIVVYSNVRMRSDGLVRTKPEKSPNVISKSTKNLENTVGTDTASALTIKSKPVISRMNIPVVTLTCATTNNEFGCSYEIDHINKKDTPDGLCSDNDTDTDTDTLHNADTCGIADGERNISYIEEELGHTNAGFQLTNKESQTEYGNANNNGNQNLAHPDNMPLKTDGILKKSNELQVKSASYLSDSSMSLDSISVSFDGNSTLRSDGRSPVKRKRKSLHFRRQRRAAILLFVLVIAFAICWLPYQIITIIKTVMGDEAVPLLVDEIVVNLLWCNSTINPLLYAVIAPNFRRNFLKFLGLSHVRLLQRKGAKSSSDPTEKSVPNERINSDS